MTTVTSSRTHRRISVRLVVAGVILAVILIGMLIPIYWLVTSSIKSSSEFGAAVPTLVPHSFSLDRFARVFSAGQILPAMGVSLVVAVSTTVVVVLLGALTSFAMVYLRACGSSVVLSMSLVTQLLPQAATLIPVFLLWNALGLTGQVSGIVLVYIAFNLPVAVWLINAYFLALPTEIFEAAELDGSGPWRMLLQIVIPISGAGIAAVGLLTLVACWGELLFAVVMLPQNLATIPAALSTVIGEHTTDQGLLLASTVIAIIPPIVFFFGAQRFLADGIAGAVKG